MSEAAAASPWAGAMQQLAAAGDRLAQRLQARGDEAAVSELPATLLGILMNVYLNDIAVQAQHPVFAPCTGYFQRLGTPNPDTVYRSAPIDEDGVYRIVGNRGTAREVTLMAFSAQMRSWPARDIRDFLVGDDGAFDLVASREPPAGHEGHWLRIEPGTATLWLRSVADDWSGQDDPWIAITRLDGHPREATSSTWIEQRLATLAARVERTTAYGIDHIDQLVTEGFVNRMKLIDYGSAGAMPLQSYHEGVFELGDDEALCIAARMPGDANYFSWSLTDALFVTLDWTNAFTSLNSSIASVDEDGWLRAVLSRRDPGIANWLQTGGHRRGVLQCRTTGSNEPTEISVIRMPLGAVDDWLPAGTARVDAANRQCNLQERQLASQRRRLW